MPGFGALRNLAKEQQAGGKRLKTMTIRLPEAGGREEHIVEHEHHPPHAQERFQFGQNQGEALAAHLSKHLGLKLPGKAAGAGDSAESEVSKADFK